MTNIKQFPLKPALATVSATPLMREEPTGKLQFINGILHQEFVIFEMSGGTSSGHAKTAHEWRKVPHTGEMR